jgi:hypothetical protein
MGNGAMRYISHRGNLTGKNEKSENSPHRIEYALSQGYDCEIDVYYNDGWFLGHDEEEYEIDFNFLKQQGLWIHAKNLNALVRLYESGTNYFWHQEDDFTLTSWGYIWAYPGKPLTSKSILVKPETHMEISEIDSITVYGICSDIIELIRERRKHAK